MALLSRNSFLPDCLKLGCGLFSCLQAQTEAQALRGRKPASLQTELNQWPPESAAALGMCQLPQSWEPIPCKYILDVCTSYGICFSGRWMNTMWIWSQRLKRCVYKQRKARNSGGHGKLSRGTNTLVLRASAPREGTSRPAPGGRRASVVLGTPVCDTLLPTPRKLVACLCSVNPWQQNLIIRAHGWRNGKTRAFFPQVLWIFYLNRYLPKKTSQ